MSQIKSVGVIGAGVIGASWTALFLSQGLQVLVSDPAPDAHQKLSEHLQTFWPALKEIGLAPGASLDNYRFVGKSLQKYYSHVDYIQENAPERPDVKTKLMAEIDAEARPEVVIASSSSGIPSSQFISACQKAPERILIGHPFNPPHLMPLVEVVPHPGTSKEATTTALHFYSAMGKSPIHIRQEIPGHAANRLQVALANEAYSLVARGVLSAADVDACVTTSLGPRWALIGPMMTNVFTGGGGREGFRHAYEDLVPAMLVWLEDMRAKQIDFKDNETFKAIQKSVDEELDRFDPAKVERQRDQLTIRILKEKQAAPDLV